ncbi:MAG TPA: hypothetical protein VMG40_16330 [Bryobacteraceae bacterium]|nr:hypothetical protein [Bryobacteraceae bacterium]
MAAFSFDQARCWFLRSGIQEPGGGIARYYRSDIQRSAPVSTEITGYGVSTLAFTGEIDAALRAARYLAHSAWDPGSHTFPFEPGSKLAYFFDIGIIARGLLAAWRATGETEFLDRARDATLSLAFDFLGDGMFHPVIALPEKDPLPHEPRWSRSPGCYQLKSALAWREVGDEQAAKLWEIALQNALAAHESFLDRESDRERLMDRLHAYCYFLEATLFEADRAEVRGALAYGIERAASLLREIAPQFERSDVCAQLLRIRLIAHHLNAVELDAEAAWEEAGRAAGYQSDSGDPRLRGGFWFGRRGGEFLPYMNPVSTAFCLQALQLWRDHRDGAWSFDLHQLI